MSQTKSTSGDAAETEPVQFSKDWKNLRVVLAHDWLTGMRGGEHCLELIGKGFPEAPIFTLIAQPDNISAELRRHRITTSWLQRIPGIMENYRYFLPAFPLAARGWKPDACDLVISTSHCVAKGIRKPQGARHICYCFTPMRYAWTFYEEYFGANPLKKLLLKPTLAGLRKWDRAASDDVDTFIGISRHVCERIKKFYGRDAELVYPPVKTDFYTPGSKPHSGFDLVVSALVPYKRIDLAVQTYTQSGYPLKVVGAGTEMAKLKSLAGPNVEFLGWAPNETIRDLYRACRLLVFPGEEDFGIVPVEVQACGRPVVALRRGGALETIAEGVSGVFFEEQTPESLQQAVDLAANILWDPAKIRKNAEFFSEQAFVDGMTRVIRG